MVVNKHDATAFVIDDSHPALGIFRGHAENVRSYSNAGHGSRRDTMDLEEKTTRGSPHTGSPSSVSSS